MTWLDKIVEKSVSEDLLFIHRKNSYHVLWRSFSIWQKKRKSRQIIHSVPLDSKPLSCRHSPGAETTRSSSVLHTFTITQKITLSIHPI